jgi:hypothetical protein
LVFLNNSRIKFAFNFIQNAQKRTGARVTGTDLLAASFRAYAVCRWKKYTWPAHVHRGRGQRKG